MVIIRIIYTIWFSIVAIIMMLIGFIFFALGSLLPMRKGVRVFRLSNTFWSWMQSILCFMPYRVTGKEYGRVKGPHVIVANHRSFADAFVLYQGLKKDFKPLAKMELKKIPVLGFMVKAACVMVDRQSKESRDQSFGRMKEVLDQGVSIFIFPEGTRNRTDQNLKDFYQGAFRLASRTGYPILTMGIKNSAKVMGGKKSGFFPAKLYGKVFPPISSEGKSPEELQERVYTLLNDWLKE